MRLLKDNLPLITFLLTFALGIPNLILNIRKDRRESRKEQAERLQLESLQHEKGVYPRRKDKHQR